MVRSFCDFNDLVARHLHVRVRRGKKAEKKRGENKECLFMERKDLRSLTDTAKKIIIIKINS